MPEVARIQDQFHLLVASRNRPELADRCIRRMIVNVNVLLVVSQRCHDTANALAQFLDIILFVVTGGNDADEFTHF